MCTGSVKAFVKLKGVTFVDKQLKTLIAIVESELSFFILFDLIQSPIKNFLTPHESTESIVNMIQHDT